MWFSLDDRDAVASRPPRRERTRLLDDLDVGATGDTLRAPWLGFGLIVHARHARNPVAVDAALVARLRERAARFFGERESDAIAFELHVTQVSDARLRAGRPADGLELLLDLHFVFAGESDAVVSTALIPGRPAPVLVTAAAARGMRPGSVIVDLAAEMGGNCELTQPGETVEVDGVTIVGEANMPSTMPFHASQMYARNVQSFLGLLLRDGELVLDFEDQIVRETCVAHEGQVLTEVVPA